MKITIETQVAAPLERVWQAWTTPADIMQWNAASDDWHCPSANVDLRVGGTYSARMEARDGSFGFDFACTISEMQPLQRLVYSMDDSRAVVVDFIPGPGGVIVRETFDAENENSAEMQRKGWQAILDRFAQHVAG